MLPRPLLTSTFGLTYRKIPVLSIGTDIYCDTSLIIEALEHFFPATSGWGTVYPSIPAWPYRGLARGLATFWTDRPLFRVTTGLIPARVWRSPFGADRAQLIGHALDPDKLEAKTTANLSALDAHLALLEQVLENATWVLPTGEPSLGDVAVYYQLRWGVDIASGKGVYDLTGGSTEEVHQPVAESVFNRDRYPRLWKWFHRFEEHVSSLPEQEVAIKATDLSWKDALRKLDTAKGLGLVPTSVEKNEEIDNKRGLASGALVSIVPDDTGRDNPTVGRLVDIGVEEVIIEPEKRGEIDVRIHFPRIGFAIRTVHPSRL